MFNPPVEGPETVVLSAEGSSTTATIADEAIVTLAATDAAAAELGPNTATFVVTRGGAVTYDRDVRISVAARPATTSRVDRRAASSFPPGNLRHPHPRRPDLRHHPRHAGLLGRRQGPETVVLSAEGSATVTIADEPPVTITATDPTRPRSVATPAPSS